MMSRLWLILIACWLSGVVSETHPTYLIQRYRTDIKSLPEVDTTSSNKIRYEIVSNDARALTEKSTEPFVMEDGLSSMNMVLNVGSRLLPYARWVLMNGGQILLGVVITLGVCVFTSTCNITTSPSLPYLDNIQYYFNMAYDTYQNLQNTSN